MSHAFWCGLVPVLTQLLETMPCYLYANFDSKTDFLDHVRRFSPPHLCWLYCAPTKKKNLQGGPPSLLPTFLTPRCSSTTPSASEASAVSAEVMCTCRKQLGTLLGGKGTRLYIYIYVIYKYIYCIYTVYIWSRQALNISTPWTVQFKSIGTSQGNIKKNVFIRTEERIPSSTHNMIDWNF